MGNICPCFEQNYVYFGEIINHTNQNNHRNQYQLENLKHFNSDELFSKYLKDQKIILANDRNKIKNSIFTNFKNGNPLNNNYSKRTNLMESLQSKNSEIYFESLSLSNNIKGEGSIVIDYYQLSKKIFDLLNEIRFNPKEASKKYLNNTNIIENNIINFDILIQGDIILWNEKVYLCCSSYLLEVEEKCRINSSKVSKNASERVSERLKCNCNVIEFCVDGLGTPKAVLSKLFYENKERIQLLISDNYFCGSICCFPSQDKNMRTIVYLVNKES
jgi:gamma-glutamylcyclotransferase (GGCT)/AIG2-like uncharacterized protein YtfP